MTESVDFFYQKEFLGSLALVHKCGNIIKDAFFKPKVISVKTEPTDLVTKTDKEVEEVLRSGLSLLLPNAPFVGEETSGKGVVLGDDATWVVDPLDGTSNFVHSNPNLCIILCLLVNKKAQFCIVFNPLLNQEWSARKGFGAQYNGAPMHVSGCAELSKALLVQQTTPVVSDAVRAIRLTNLATFLPLVQGLRVTGSSGIDLAFLAMGAVDAFFHFGHHIWDYAGPALLVKEAGGVVLDPSGGDLDPLARRSLAAATGALAKQLLGHITLLDLGRDGD